MAPGGHLPYDVESPTALLKVELDSQQAVEAKVLTPSKPRRVLCASAFYRNTPRQEAPLVLEEPTLWIFSRAITGQVVQFPFPAWAMRAQQAQGAAL